MQRREKVELNKKEGSLHQFFGRLSLETFLHTHRDVQSPGDLKQVDTCMRVFEDVFEMKAGGNQQLPMKLRTYNANKDKISIVLNKLDNGLILNRSSTGTEQYPATDDYCCQHVLILALAARDPVALCTTGPQLQIHPTFLSWLCRPSRPDSGIGYFHTLPRLPVQSQFRIDPEPSTAFIELSLVFVIILRIFTSSFLSSCTAPYASCKTVDR